MKLRKATRVVKPLMLTAALTATTAAPAWAGQNVSAREWNPWGSVYGAFHHKGDYLQLVDSCGDSLGGYLQLRNGAERKTYYRESGGQSHPCGERWINRNFREGRDIGIRVCLAKPGPDFCSPWRWGIA
jgi:hypothetical protein